MPADDRVKGKNVSESVERKSVITNMFWKFGEIFCTDGVSFVISIILARILMPEEYGQIAMVNIFVSIANVFVVNGLGTALIQKKNADNLDFSSVLFFNFGFSVVLYFVLFCIAPCVAVFYRDEQLIVILRVLGLKILIASINSVLNAYVARNMMFKKLFVVNFISAMISGIVGIFMAYCGFGVWALVGQVLACDITVMISTGILTRWMPMFRVSWNRLKSLVDYGWKILASSLIRVGYDQLSELIIGKAYTASDLAYYSRGKKYPALVVDSINSSISSVLFPAISKEQDSRERVKAMVRRSIKTSTYIIAPLILGFAVLADPIIEFILTEKWLPCVPYLRIACLYYVLQPVQTANLQAIRAVGRSDIILKLDIIKRGFGIAFLILVIKQGPLAIAFSPVVMSIVATVVNLRPNIKLISYSYKEQFADLLPNLGLAVSMAAVVCCCNCFLSIITENNLLLIMVGVMVGGTYYLIVSILLKNESFQYCWGLIKHCFPSKSM